MKCAFVESVIAPDDHLPIASQIHSAMPSPAPSRIAPAQRRMATMPDPASSINYHYRFLREIAVAGRGSIGLLKPDLTKTDDETTQAEIVAAQVIAGTPKRVAEQLDALREETGPFGTLIMTSFDWDQPELWKRSMDLLVNDAQRLADASPS